MLLSAPPSVDLRLLTADDWVAVADIYWEGMRDGLATFETEVPPWETWDAAHLPDHRLVADRLGEVVGWSALAPASTRRCYAGVVENSVYVAREARGLGIGRALLEGVICGAEADQDHAQHQIAFQPKRFSRFRGNAFANALLHGLTLARPFVRLQKRFGSVPPV